MDQTANQLNTNANKYQSLWDPIDELDLQVKKQDKEDYEQVLRLLGTILTYPSQELAELHMESNRLGQRDLRKDAEDLKELKSKGENEMGEEAVYCPCCGFIKQEENIKLCTPLKEINNLGISTFLYFETAKNLGLLCLVLFLVYSIYALVTNLISAGKINESFSADVLSISLASKMTDDTQQNRDFYLIQCYIGLGLVIIWCLMLFGLKYFEKEQEVRVGEETISAADFSITIDYMPRDITKEDLQKQLDDYYQTITNVPVNIKKPLKIMKYNVGKPFYLAEDALVDDEVKELKEKNQEYIDLFVSWVEERQDSPTFSTTKDEREEKYNEYGELLEKMNNKMQELQAKVEEEIKKENNDTLTTVFVTFETNFAKNMIVDLNDPSFLSKLRYYITCCQGGNRFKLIKSDGTPGDIEIEAAPEPEDIIWQNLGIPECEILKRKVLTYFVTLILLGASFAAVYGLSRAQLENENNRALSLAISLVISLINVILGQVIRALTLLQRDFTKTKHQTSLGFKSTLAQLINSILVPMIVNALIKDKIYEQNGLVDDVFMLGLTNAFVGPAIKVFDPGYIINRILKSIKSSPNRRLSSNQTQLNTAFEYIQFEVGYEYIYLVNLYLFTCFFVSLQPIIALTTTVGIFCMYWSQKYSVFNRMRRPVPGTDLINVAMFQLIYLGGIFYSLGALTWSNFFENGFPKEALIPNLIALGFSILIALLPYRAIFGLLFEDEGHLPLEYEKNRILLASEYDRLNPVTSKEGFEDYMNFLEKEKERMNSASDEEKKKLFDKFAKQQARGHQRPSGNLGGGGPNILPFMPPPRMNFGPPMQMRQPPPGFQSGFNQPPPNMNQPPPNMNQPPPNMNQPPPNMNQPPMFNRPPPGFQQPGFRPPPGFQAPPGYRPPPGFGAPPPGFGAPPGFRPPPGFQPPPGYRPVQVAFQPRPY